MISPLNRQQTRPIKKSSSLKPRSRRSNGSTQASLSNYDCGVSLETIRGVGYLLREATP
jgi:hypothetical protein